MTIQSEFMEKGRLLLGVSGAIAATELNTWLIYLKTNVCRNINVILTEQSLSFITDKGVSLISGNPVHVTFFDDPRFPAPHVSLTDWADIFVVIPSTANIIGKVANGIADDLLSTAILAAECPVLFVPSMNTAMWNRIVVQRNIKQIQDDGYLVHIPKVKENVYKASKGEYTEGMAIQILEVAMQIFRILNRQKEGVV